MSLNISAVYRLDRLTSGLLIFGKNYEATNKIIKQIKDRQVSKQYLCRVEGDFPRYSNLTTLTKD